MSVILQTYNHEPFIAQAIEGVLLQRVSFPMELLIADDASTDGTRDTVRRYARSHPDLVRLVLPDANLGPTEMFHRALGESRGEYIAYLDGDDYWTSPYKLSRQAAGLDDHPDWAGCFHRVALVYETTGHPHPSGYAIPEVSKDAIGLDELVSGICFIPGPSWMHRRTSMDQMLSLDGLEWSDWLIHISAARSGAMGFLDQVLAAYRVHPGGAFNGLDRSAQLEEDLRFYRRLSAELPTFKRLIERCIANRHCQLGAEKTRLPYDAPLLVLDPDDDLPLYFNGRWARRFPGLDGDIRGEASLDEFDRACAELAQLPPAVPDARPQRDPVETDGANVFLVVPRRARPWLEAHHDLVGRLDERADRVFDDDWCSIYRTKVAQPPPQPEVIPSEPLGGGLEVVSVGVADPLPRGLRGWLDAPKHGEMVAAHAIYVLGWVLGEQEPVDAVDFELNEELICRTPVAVSRPDLVEAFGDQPSAGHAGFCTIVNVAGEAGSEDEVKLFAVMRSGSRLPLGILGLHRRM